MVKAIDFTAEALGEIEASLPRTTMMFFSLEELRGITMIPRSTLRERVKAETDESRDKCVARLLELGILQEKFVRKVDSDRPEPRLLLTRTGQDVVRCWRSLETEEKLPNKIQKSVRKAFELLAIRRS